MSEITRIIGALSAGAILGTVFFGGLWWTVNRGLTATAPGLWFGLSALLRLGVTCSGLYLVARAGFMSLLACLCGILLARVAVTRLTRPARVTG
jgi:F1F0 ATPase subunit 2